MSSVLRNSATLLFVEFLRLICDHEVFADEMALVLETMHFKQPLHFAGYSIDFATRNNVFGNIGDIKARNLLLMRGLQSINEAFDIFAIDLDRIEKYFRLILPFVMPKSLLNFTTLICFYLVLLFIKIRIRL